MKLILSVLCFALAGFTYSFIPERTVVYPTYPTVYIVATNVPPTATLSPIEEPQVTPIAQVVFVDEPIYQSAVIQVEPVNDVIQVVVVPEVLVQEIIVTPDAPTNYDPSLYDEWQPYVEPQEVEAVNVWDLDNLWDVVPVVSAGFPPCPDPLPIPFVTWDMAQRAANLQSDRQDFEQISIPASVVSQIMVEGGGYFPAEGNIRMPENDVVGMLMASGASVCQNGSITLYGNGVQSFLDNLYQTYLERN